MTFEEYKAKKNQDLKVYADDKISKYGEISMYEYGYMDGIRFILDHINTECPTKFEYDFSTSFDKLEDGAAYVVLFKDGVTVKELVQALTLMNDKVKDRGITFVPKLPYMESIERSHD